MPLSRDPSAPTDSTAKRASFYERLRRATVVRRALQLPVVRRVLAPARGDRSIHRFIRYSMVSVVAILISQVAILICTWIFHLSGVAANTIGAVAATPASYELNRKWAWGKTGKSHLWREVVPFWSLSLLGFLASTGTVSVADSMAKSHGVTGLPRTFAIMGASLFAYGVVWIVKFLIFNRLFVSGPVAAPLSGPETAAQPMAEPVARAKLTDAPRAGERPPTGYHYPADDPELAATGSARPARPRFEGPGSKP